jgi:hypothetical protein
MCVTVHELMLLQADEKHKEQLARFQSDLEGATRRITEEAQNRASRVVTATLEASKAAVQQGIQDGMKDVLEQVGEQMLAGEEQQTQLAKYARHTALVIGGSAVVSLLGALLVAWRAF